MNRRTISIILGVVILIWILALYGVILRGVLNERREQDSLQEQIAIMEQARAGQQGGAQVLPTRQAELATLQAELESVQMAFPSQVDSTEVLDFITTAAVEQGLLLRRLEAGETLTGTLSSRVAYVALAYEVEVEGQAQAIAAFLASLEAGPISTLTLEQVRLEAQAQPGVYRAAALVRVYFRESP